MCSELKVDKCKKHEKTLNKIEKTILEIENASDPLVQDTQEGRFSRRPRSSREEDAEEWSDADASPASQSRLEGGSRAKEDMRESSVSS
ncbi:hypothetical protein JTE90_000949 [Oedothorax gibbosus]|uniref:Uncharacterized protein n=1 Tax=Oedothorax gibbosus TaxID=931172 RepID=A0AAV6U6Q9_9ARAC|nr:hypothetical protein JTE90_000949 [Oedothorax gibbosus]